MKYNLSLGIHNLTMYYAFIIITYSSLPKISQIFFLFVYFTYTKLNLRNHLEVLHDTQENNKEVYVL